MDLVKEDLCQLNELLFALNGFYSRFDQVNSSLNVSAFENRFSTLQVLPQVGELLKISCMYSQLNVYLAEFCTETDQFKFLIYSLLTKTLQKTYIKDLVSFDFYNKMDNVAVIKLNALLKYKYFFIDILNICNELNDSNKSLALLKLTNLLENKYNISMKNEENDPFFQGIWSWLIRGTVPYHLRDSFFITSHSFDNYSLDYSKFPHSIEPRNAMQIHNIGNLIRYIHAHGVQMKLQQSELFWKYFPQRHALYNSSVLFKYFLCEIKTLVFEDILQVTKIKENYLEYLQHLKTFFFYGNECFWTNFVYLRRNSLANPDGRALFRRANYETFNDTTAEFYISNINMKMETNKNVTSLKLFLRYPPLIKIMLAENTLNRYQTIFGHLYKLHSTRCELIANWKEQKTQSRRPKYYYLHYRLVQTFSILYTYSKFYIEYKMAAYTESIESIIEIDQIQKLHDACLLDITKLLFIKNTYIVNLQNGLVDIAHELRQPDSNIDSLLNRFYDILDVYRNTFEISRKHVNIFAGILDMI